jgi:hypothetical protein
LIIVKTDDLKGLNKFRKKELVRKCDEMIQKHLTYIILQFVPATQLMLNNKSNWCAYDLNADPFAGQDHGIVSCNYVFLACDRTKLKCLRFTHQKQSSRP